MFNKRYRKITFIYDKENRTVSYTGDDEFPVAALVAGLFLLSEESPSIATYLKYVYETEDKIN